MALTDAQVDAAVVVRRVLSALTLITCTLIVIAIILFQKYRFPSSRLILWLSAAAALQSICYLIPWSDTNEPACDFQAIWVSFFDWAIALWICVIAFNLFQSVVLRIRDTTRYEKWYHVFVWSTSAFASLLPEMVSRDIYGDTGAWCWIVKDYQAWRIGLWYGPLILFFVYVCAMYVWIVYLLYSQRSSEIYQREGEEELRARWKNLIKLTRYPLIFVLLWIFPIINRAQNWVAGDDGVFWLLLMHTICTSVQGTINSIVYCYDEDLIKLCTWSGIKNAMSYFLSEEKRKNHQIQRYALRSSENEDTYEKDNHDHSAVAMDEIPLDDEEDT